PLRLRSEHHAPWADRHRGGGRLRPPRAGPPGAHAASRRLARGGRGLRTLPLAGAPRRGKPGLLEALTKCPACLRPRKSSGPRTQGGRIPRGYVADRGRRTTTICSGVRHGGCFVRGSKPLLAERLV